MAHLPSLKQLRYLCAVAEYRHFGRAAKACFVSQSTLSGSITDLESRLGVTLLERSNKNVFLTPLAEEIVARSQQLLNDANDLVEICQAAQGPFKNAIRLGIIPTIAPYLLPPLLKKVKSLHPDFSIHIREDLSAVLVEALHNGELDLLLLALPFPANGVTTQHLYFDKLLLAYYKQHPVKDIDSLSIATLKNQSLILLEDGHCLRDHAMEACKLKSDEILTPYRATSLNTIVQMVANGMGITLLPKMALQSSTLNTSTIKTKEFVGDKVHRSIGLMWRERSPRGDEFKLFGEFIQQQVVTKLQ